MMYKIDNNLFKDCTYSVKTGLGTGNVNTNIYYRTIGIEPFYTFYYIETIFGTLTLTQNKGIDETILAD